MSQVGDAVGGFFDGLFGGGKPEGNGIDPVLARQQAEMEAQQKAQIEQQKKQLEQQRIAMLRGRFSTGGSGSASTGDAAGNNDAQAASLFSRITGRTE